MLRVFLSSLFYIFIFLIPNESFSEAFTSALQLILTADTTLWGIVALSLQVSLTAVFFAALFGIPLGAVLAIKSFWGRAVIIVVINALMGLPPVVVGLCVYLMLSKAGPLGILGLLYTPTAMIIAQTFLIAPIIAALSITILKTLHEEYKDQLTNRLDPSMSIMQGINAQVKKRPKTVVFAEGEDQNMLKAAVAYKNSRLGTPVVIGNEKRVKEQLKEIGLDENYKIKIVNSTDKNKRELYSKKLYSKLQRKGLLERDVDRLIRNDRIVWGASMLSLIHISEPTRQYKI